MGEAVPMCTPGMIVAPVAIHTFRSAVIGSAAIQKRRSAGSVFADLHEHRVEVDDRMGALQPSSTSRRRQAH
jgi:hypothetical protein